MKKETIQFTEDVLNKFVLFFCILCGALFLSCRPAPASVVSSPELFSALAETLKESPDMQAEMLARHYNETVTASDYEYYVIIKRTVDYYDGGAHGMYGTHYSVFDRKAARFVTLADVADKAKLSDLSQAAENELRKKFELREDEHLTDAGFFKDNLELTENFFLNEDGIGFHWNPYELAPYVFGEIEVVVPLK
jgi:hypothetical protein